MDKSNVYRPLDLLATVAQMRRIEAELFTREDSYEIMWRAAAAAARHAAEMELPDPLVAVAGPGNNGGDACLAAMLLAQEGRQVELRLPLGPPKQGDGLKAWREAEQAGVPHQTGALDLPPGCGVIDGLFGIGLDRPLSTEAQAAVAAINENAASVLALDLPSGLCADTGQLLPIAVKARRTVTFLGGKPGLLMRRGPDVCGGIEHDHLGCKLAPQEGTGFVILGLLNPLALLRRADSHKGSFGSLAVIGGAEGMLGALYLATRAAVAHGCGKVFAHPLAPDAPPVDVSCPEIMWRRTLPAADDGLDAVAIGPGLGVEQAARDALDHVLALPVPAVFDADALNLFAADAKLMERLRAREHPAILTPHPGEAARLLQCERDAIQEDRVAAARRLADQTQSCVVLKGRGTVIAEPADGTWMINTTGSPALAQAGSGDLLTGIMGALLAQGMGATASAGSAAWLHGRGGRAGAHTHGGCIGVPLNAIMHHSSRQLACFMAKLDISRCQQ